MSISEKNGSLTVRDLTNEGRDAPRGEAEHTLAAVENLFLGISAEADPVFDSTFVMQELDSERRHWLGVGRKCAIARSSRGRFEKERFATRRSHVNASTSTRCGGCAP
jgi:hypothetical protein